MEPKRRILVVEDDATLREVLVEALEAEQYAVIHTGDAAHALELATTGAPDLILLDLALPGRSGIQVLQEIKDSAPTHRIPVLIVSGYALVLTRDVLRRADGTLAKPFDLNDLLSRVDRLSSQHAILRALAR